MIGGEPAFGASAPRGDGREHMDIHFTRLEAKTLIQAAELALEHDQPASVFYDDHRTAVRRAVRKIEDYLDKNPDLS